jgi:hypothetical protein
MTNGAINYSGPVTNKDGYVILMPDIGDHGDLLQGYPVNPYAESETQLFPVGTRAIRGIDEYLYCKNGAGALATLGTPIQSAAAVHAEQDDDIVCGAAAAIGDYLVVVTSTANLDGSPNDEDNTFAEGYLYVNDEAGQGQMYKIKSNEALVTTGNSNFILYDPLTVALTTSSELGLIMNPCYKVIATAAVLSGCFIGVNLLAISANYWFWAKVRGPAPVNMHAAVAKGTYVVVGTTAAKADPSAAVTTEIIIGEPLTPGVADTEKALVYLYGR